MRSARTRSARYLFAGHLQPRHVPVDTFSPDTFSPDTFSPDTFSPDAAADAQTRSLIGISAFDSTWRRHHHQHVGRTPASSTCACWPPAQLYFNQPFTLNVQVLASNPAAT
ncbi:MAG: hypothetical protein R2838_17035 [Caldilineaceae bacterium]